MIDLQEHRNRQVGFKESLVSWVRNKRVGAREIIEQQLKEEDLSDIEGNPMMDLVVDMTPAVYILSIAWDTFIFIGINHFLLFSDYRLKGDNDARRFTAEEFYRIFQSLDPLAVEALLRKLDCSQIEFEGLLSAWKEKRTESFISCLKGLSCDLSGLASLCVRIIHIQQQADAGFGIKGYYSEYSPELDLDAIEAAPCSDLLDWLEKRVVAKALSVEGLRTALTRYMGEDKFYPFEKEIMDSLVNDPVVVANDEKIARLSAQHNVPSNRETITSAVSPRVSEVEKKYQFPVPQDVFDDEKKVQDDTEYIKPLLYEVTESVEQFQRLFHYLLKWGRIEEDSEQRAMLRLLTGYDIQGAAPKVKWYCDKYMPRVLYHVVKHIAGGRSKYTTLGSVSFVLSNRDDVKTQKMNRDLDAIINGNTSKIVDNGIPDEISNALVNCYPDLFPMPRE